MHSGNKKDSPLPSVDVFFFILSSLGTDDRITLPTKVEMRVDLGLTTAMGKDVLV